MGLIFKIRVVLGVSLMFPGLALSGQTGSLSGTVSHEGQPLPYVHVVVADANIGTFTDSAGQYFVEVLPYKSYVVTASLVGFRSVQKVIEINRSAKQTLDFSLEESTTTLGEVVVSANLKEVDKLDSPVPVEVYSHRFFLANPTPSVFESLQNVNGVRPQLNCNVCNTGDIHINGLEGPYSMVLIDGMPIVSGLSTVYGLTGIPQSLIERVEVVKGPASTLYGSEAVGGLINIITKNTWKAPTLSLDAFTTTWQESNFDVGFRRKVNRSASMLLGVNFFTYQNPIDHNDDGFTDVTLQSRLSVFNKWSFARKQGRTFDLAARYIYEDRWGGQMNWNPAYRGGSEIYAESIYTNRWETFSTYQLPLKAHINLQVSANGHEQNSVYGQVPFSASQYIGFGQLTWLPSIGSTHNLIAGAAYRFTYYDDNTTATGGDKNEPSRTHLPGLFVQDEIKLNRKNRLLLGLRYDRNSLHGSILTPRVNYKWNSLNKKNTLRLSLGNGYRVANIFTEDHAALTGARTVIFDGELLPEKSWNGNLNFVKKIVIGQTVLGIDASAFYTYFHNRIVPDYDTDPNKIFYGNLEGSAVSQGISLNIDVLTGSNLKVLTGATLMDVKVTDDGITRRQILTEKFSGVWNISYQLKRPDISIDYTGNLYSPMRLPTLGEGDQRPHFSPWWSIQNIQITRRLGPYWEIYGGVKNLLNFTPPANSIARPFDPFDKQVSFDESGRVIPTTNNPQGLTFDPSYVFAPNQGTRGFLGIRYILP